MIEVDHVRLSESMHHLYGHTLFPTEIDLISKHLRDQVGGLYAFSVIGSVDCPDLRITFEHENDMVVFRMTFAHSYMWGDLLSDTYRSAI